MHRGRRQHGPGGRSRLQALQLPLTQGDQSQLAAGEGGVEEDEDSDRRRTRARMLQVLTRRIPGGLAMSVTLMGTIMAATTGIVGASVVMLTLVALPPMMQRGYQKELAVGTLASAGTLGSLIPPSITLIVYGIATETSIGRLFLAGGVPRAGPADAHAQPHEPAAPGRLAACL